MGGLFREGGILGLVKQLGESGIEGIKFVVHFVKSVVNFGKFSSELVLKNGQTGPCSW